MEYANLDVFVLTYNRADYLKIMLESLCNQTAKGFNIKVLNNASTDNTIDIVNEIKRQYPSRNIELITHKENIGNPNNFKKSQELAHNEYTAVFHDDDAIHPEYINTAMQLLNRHKDAVMCTGDLQALWNVTNYNFGGLEKDYFLYKKQDGVYLNLLINRPCFASNIYKTEAYKRISYHPEKYGKLHDIIFMLELNKLGEVVFIQGRCIRYRLHAGMDSNTLTTGPYPDEIINIISRIKELNNNHKFCGQYLLYLFAKFLYDWSFLDKYLTWEAFLLDLIKTKVFTKAELFLFKNKITRFFFKNFIKFRKKHYRHIIKNKYGKRF